MEHFYHLIETEDTIDIGSVYIDTEQEPISFSVNKPMSYKGVLMLFTSEGKPVYEPNAYIMSRRIVEGTKDIKPTCFHLLRYYRFLQANHLSWYDQSKELQRYPIFLYRAFLNREIEKGNLKRSVAVAALSVVRRFYLFCFRHGYISTLPFTVTGRTKYGQVLTDCSIRSESRDTNLQPLNDLDLKHVRDNWYCNGLSLEFRLMISVALCSGLRSIEITDIKPKHFVIPKGFTGRIFTDIWIGPAHECKTKYDINRQISMPIWLMQQMNEYHQSARYLKRKQLYFMNTGNLDAPAFINKDGNMFTTQSINTQWAKLRSAIQENSNPHFKHKEHDCRATFGAYKLESLVTIKELSMMQALTMLKNEMGHKDLDTTMLYLKHYEGNPEKNQVPELTMSLLEDEILS